MNDELPKNPASGEGDKHVVILIHGIRDFADWQTEVAASLREAQFVPAHTNYGRFDAFRFLAPISLFRNQAIETVWIQIRDIRKQYGPSARYSVIAHSFGTFVFARILQKGFDMKFHRVIFCGSVVKYNFPFEHISDRFETPIINDVGTRDAWPALGESATWGYGSAGTYGFHRPRVEDRYHYKAGHGYFLRNKFCKRFWIPVLRGDPNVPMGDNKSDTGRWWLTLLYIIA